MAEPGPSRSAAIARPTFMSHASIDHLGVARAPSEQPNPLLPSATYSTSSISGGTINNVNRDLHNNYVNHNYYGISSVTSLNPASQPSPSLPPLNDAPIDRISSCFTGRKSELDFIALSFDTFQSDKPTRFVIYGMPGLGKSQLALHYANVAYTAGIYSHVFWVSASTVERLSQGLVRILDLLNHADRHHPDQAVRLAAVRLWFEQSDRYGCLRWQLIFDNVTVESAHFLREHLPRQNTRGTILITTRTLNIAESVANVAGQEHLIFELKALSKAQSVSLLLKKAGIQTNAPEDLASAEKLVSRIGCLPLAVEQAGSYMKRSGLKNTRQLQRMYDESGLKEVIRWENDLTTYEATSILSTFTVQFQKLDEIDPDAHKLLKTLAFLDPENIPIDILLLGARAISGRLAENAERSLIVSAPPKRKVPAIRRLLKKLKGKQHMESIPDIPEETYIDNPLEGVPPELIGLITLICSEERIRAAFRHFEDLSIAQPLYNDKPSLHIHDLIQWVLRQSMLIHQEEGYRALAIALLCNAFWTTDHPDEPQSWDECERFVPHFTVLGTQDQQHSMMSEEYLITNESIARYFISRSQYSEAKTLLDRVLAHRRRLLGSTDIGTVSVIQSLAVVYEKLGRYEEAESLLLPVLAVEEKQLGADHLNTLMTMNNLAIMYQGQGKFNEAESLCVRALAGLEKQLGADHRITLSTIHNLAVLYKSQEKFSEAESLYARVLAGREKQLVADHPDTLRTMNNLANMYQSQGKFNEAESLYVRALAGWEKQRADHPGTLTPANNLALLYKSQGKFEEAESLLLPMLAVEEKQREADYPETLMAVNNLANLYRSQRKFNEAESLYARGLAGWEKQLGADHPSTLTAVHNLALLYYDQGRYDEAESFYERVLAGREKELGADHPSTLKMVHSLAVLYRSQEKFNEAESFYVRALAGWEKQLGADHPSTLTMGHNLAVLYQSQEKFHEAESLYARTLAGLEKQLGPDHLSTLTAVHNLAVLYEGQGRYDEAESFYGKVLAGREKQLGADHPSTLTVVFNLTDLYESQGRHDEADSFDRRAFAGLAKQFGADHLATLITAHDFA
ncbi:TPR-like protein [Athelia psychrophila]|uniref:TPR-like protein n=1 Tax=Athelia psychrophila TaxID=1759441 RepID=A0A166AHT2_9AGAM|nr:TPR-like protein [Fibularhizoctonia sp. CBS 109695]